LAIVGSVNIPIIHFSVHWWNTLHQKESAIQFKITEAGLQISSGLAAPYQVTLWMMLLAFTCMFIWLHMKGMRAEILRRRVETMTITRVSQAEQLKPAE
ncbi:MAG: heme transporter HemC, partial [Alphaproteobacteria bacterium]